MADAADVEPAFTLDALKWGKAKFYEETGLIKIYARVPAQPHTGVFFDWFAANKEQLKEEGFRLWKSPSFSWFVAYQVKATPTSFKLNADDVERWRVRFSNICSKWAPSGEHFFAEAAKNPPKPQPPPAGVIVVKARGRPKKSDA